MWGQICWRRRVFRFAMENEDTLDEASGLSIPRNPCDFTGAKRVHQRPLFSILPHGRRRLPHNRTSIHGAKTEIVTFHWFLDAFS